MADTETAIDWRNLPPVEDAPEIPSAPSQSFLKIHDRCDRAAMLYLKYGSGAGSIEMNRGAIFHEVAAALVRLAVEEGEPRVPPEVGKDVLIEIMDENPHLQVSAEERDALRYMVSNFCSGEVWDPERIVAVEGALSIEVGGYEITGHVDRVDDLGGGTLLVTDYKTSWSMPDTEEWKTQAFNAEGKPRFAGDFQTQLYALMLAEGLLDGMPIEGYERFKLRLVYPRFLFPEGLGERTVTVTKLQLLDFKLDVEQQLRRLTEVNGGEGRWQPTPGKAACRECPAEYECPLPPLLRPESQHASLNDVEDLEKAATAWFFMQRGGETLKARIKKAVIRLAEADPSALVLPNGEIGVQIGTDRALVLSTTATERLKDKQAHREAIERAVEFGEPYVEADHYTYSQTTSLDSRKI